MTLSKFNEIFNKQIEHCREVLSVKGNEYVFNGDRLEHFKKSAAEQETRPKQALWGMASKHFTSLGSMCKAENEFHSKIWNEKITDAMNYLLLLWALVLEEAESDGNA